MVGVDRKRRRTPVSLQTTIMVDVLFILLIFFILVSRIRQTNVDVDLPELRQSGKQSAPAAPGERLRVAIDGAGHLYVDGERQDDLIALRARLEGARQSAGQRLPARWRDGPADPHGILFDASDRPLLCMSLSDGGEEAVVGGSDHAAYCFDTQGGERTRQLHSKRHGHAEWVTGVAHVAGGGIVTCGMDGKMCLWERGAATCTDLLRGNKAVTRLGDAKGERDNDASLTVNVNNSRGRH